MFIAHSKARALIALLFLFSISSAHAQLDLPGLNPQEPDDVREQMQFGHAVGIIGNTAIVGAPGTDGHGAVYMFTLTGSTWTRTAKLLAPDVAPGSFGSQLIYDGTLLISDPVRGHVYYFTWDGRKWKPRAILSGGATGFGAAMAMEGCTALITSTGDSGPANQPGFVHVFDRCSTSDGNWKFIKSFTAPGTRSDEEFGSSIALSGNQLLVGAPTQMSLGSAYYFVKQSGNWVFKQRLAPKNPHNDLFFGSAVALHDTLAVIGEPTGRLDPDESGTGGIAFTFGLTSTGWAEVAEIRPAEATGWAGFGTTVSVLTDRVIISAPDGLGTQLQYGGTIYIYKRSGNALTFESTVSGNVDSLFGATGVGFAFSVSGSSILVGAPRGGRGFEYGIAGVTPFPPP